MGRTLQRFQKRRGGAAAYAAVPEIFFSQTKFFLDNLF
jgi:hypothetical protein